MQELTKEAIDKLDALFLKNIARPFEATCKLRKDVKHAPHHLTIGDVRRAAQLAHPNKRVYVEFNIKDGITLTIVKKGC